MLPRLLLQSSILLVNREAHVDGALIEGPIIGLGVVEAESALISLCSFVSKLVQGLLPRVLVESLEDIIAISTDACPTLACGDNSRVVMTLREVPALLYLGTGECLFVGLKEVIGRVVELVFILLIVELGFIVPLQFVD